jgi:hypothetical protein
VVLTVQIRKVPQGYHSVNPSIAIKEAEKLSCSCNPYLTREKLRRLMKTGGYYAEVR